MQKYKGTINIQGTHNTPIMYNGEQIYVPQRTHGWANDLYSWLGDSNKAMNDPKYLAQWFREFYNEYGSKNESVSKWINSLTDSELGSLLDEYWNPKGSNGHILGNDNELFNIDAAMKTMQGLADANLPEPSKSFQDILDETSAAIDAENAQAMRLYDDALKYQKDLYNSQMGHLDENYRRYANDVLSLDYQKNAQLVGGLENNMNKARQNALEAGASAGIRLANNVNTLLSTQNQQANQSLQTSNNLAQMLMNQQNAAMGLKNNLANAYATNANQKAGLIPGTYERKQNSALNSWDLYNMSYEDQVSRAAQNLENSALKDSYLKYKQGQPASTGNQGY